MNCPAPLLTNLIPPPFKNYATTHNPFKKEKILNNTLQKTPTAVIKPPSLPNHQQCRFDPNNTPTRTTRLNKHRGRELVIKSITDFVQKKVNFSQKTKNV